MMLIQIRKKQLLYSSFRFAAFVFLTITIIIIIIPNIPHEIQTTPFRFFNTSTVKNNVSMQYTTSTRSSLGKMTKHVLFSENSTFVHHNKSLETTIECVGSLYNQSCLYRNLYYVNSTFMILTVKGSQLPSYAVRTNAFVLSPSSPNKRQFNSYSDLEKFVRDVIDPMIIPYVTLHFGQYWVFNIGYALFDGLYPAYIALIRFSPRHKHPFRILADIAECDDCWSEDIYSRFAGLGILKRSFLNKMSKRKWFVFDELVMGSGALCQRCTQPNLQLPGGVELDGARLFRDRMYQQHGLIPSPIRQKHSAQGRTSRDILAAYIIDNKRFTNNERKEIHSAINEINSYTNIQLNKTRNKISKLEWPLIRVNYLYYDQVKATKMNLAQIDETSLDSQLAAYDLIESHFIAQLRIVRKMDIHISGPGTGQMYQTFLSDGSVHINLGGLRPIEQEHTEKAYTSYLEQYMASGAPYIKALYYPINERPKGIQKDQIIKLIRKAGQLISQGFSLPVNPKENLAADGQLFTEMCEKDEKFCSFITKRSSDKHFVCLHVWIEDIIHEYNQWNLGGIIDKGKQIICPLNHTLLHELRKKYGIKHN